jgi:AraC-like DNA-binding protein/ligand-binding sensor protein
MTAMHEQLTFIFQPEVQDIFNHFTALFDIRIAYFAPDGAELKVGLERPWCEYCRLIRVGLGDQQLCVAMDRDRREEAAGKRHLVHYRCHAGLIEAIKPLYFDMALLGYIMIGQIRTDLALPTEKEWRWRERFGDERLRLAFESIPLMGNDRLKHIIGLFATLVDFVVQQHFISIKGRKRTSGLVDWLRQHYMESITLGEAAAMVGVGGYRLAHLLREEQDMSFKQLQQSIRLREAESLLAHDPGMSIKEVATRCGFEDPLYFSRVFRKVHGHAPSAHRGSG